MEHELLERFVISHHACEFVHQKVTRAAKGGRKTSLGSEFP